MLIRNPIALAGLIIFKLLVQSSLCLGQSSAETAKQPLTVKITQPDGTVRVVPVPQTREAWMRAAQADIDAAHRILAENHPGMADPENPGFSKLLDEARQN
ncbi:MAG: hypothetical protein ACKO81_12200, partial [Planctomycetota bacterium]